MNKIKKGDQVIVLKGKDRSSSGKVIKIFTARNCALVEGINIAKKHIKPNPQKGITGGISDRENPISLSNLSLYDPVSKKPSRVGIKILENNKKARYFKSNNELVET